jgi:serine beta-lactamase-like protein LACTB, mitochondrial
MHRVTPVRRADGSTAQLPNSIPGMSAAVAVRGRVVWSEGFGLADVERRVPATAETRYRVGSVSKLLTAAALARLVQAGRVDLDAPVQRYAPSFPVKPRPVTLRQLAGHQSGIRHYRIPGDPVGERTFATLAEGLAIFANDTLLFAPGTRYAYSSYGYNLLGVAIEGASGRPFLDAVRELVTRPLALWSVVADHRDSVVRDRTAFYDYGRDQRVVNARWDDASYKWPSGGYLATAADLASFGSAFLAPGFLDERTLQLVFTPQRLASGEATVVGLGWRIGRDSAGRTIYHHGGTSSPGGRAMLVVYPAEQVVVAMLANIAAIFDERDAGRLAGIFGGW